jgi:SAM-dependent methyltransferase
MNKIDKLQQDWDDLAKIDPMWAILSNPLKQQGKWDVEEFFGTGRHQIRNVLGTINSLDVILNTGVALDFGCGLGRLTQALAEEFDMVYGVDISAKMIEHAGQFNKFRESCKYFLNTKSDLQLFDDASFDFIYTYIVLQHMPPELMLGYLKEFIRTLRVQGILMFQVPIQRLEHDTNKTYLTSLPKLHHHRVMNKLRGILIGHGLTDRYYRLRKLGISSTWLYKTLGFRPEIQMHTLDEVVVTNLMLEQGMKIVHIEKREDDLTKMLWAEFVAVKPLTIPHTP